MPQFARSLDVYQGFNFKKDKQTAVGFITEIQVGTLSLAKDFTTIKDPENPDNAIAGGVVAVLNNYLWETGVTDAMYFTGHFSVANKQNISSLLLGSFSNIQVTFKYVIYEYDPIAKKYFKSNYLNDAALNGILEKNGDELTLSVAENPSNEVQSPKNYTFQIGIKPQSTEQALNLAVASQKNVAKKWGVTETQ